MQFQIFTFLLLSFFLASCGDDLKSNSNKKSSPEAPNTPISTDPTGPYSSYIHRTRGVPVLTYEKERELLLNNKLPAAYRVTPVFELDDEGTEQVNVNTVNSLGRPSTPCGLDFTTGLAAMLKDCEDKNKEKSKWQGQQHGPSGEGFWSLVSLNEMGQEIWLDHRTGMIWSDILTEANWCKASGNRQAALPPSLLVDCKILGEDTDLCAGLSGSMNFQWRLPTRNDFLAADLNGLRFVLKKGTSKGSWTATMQRASSGHEHAWVYHLGDGTLTAEELISDREVRCIGAASYK